MAVDQESLLKMIDAAFPRVPIRSAEAFKDEWTSYPDGSSYMAELEGKTWDQLDRAFIVRRADALGFLDTPGLVAVLPVHLQSVVEDRAMSPAADMLMQLLTRPQRGIKPGLGAPRFKALVEALTDAQQRAIASVMEDFAQCYGDDSPGLYARMALESYWKDQLPISA